jgi:hypothetical protein
MVGWGIINAARVVLLLVGSSALGAPQLEPRLQVGLEGRYDDDALLRHGDTGAPVRGELLTKVIAQGGLHAENHTWSLDAWYAPDFQLRYFSRSTRIDHRAGVDLQTRLTPRTRFTGELRGWRVSDPTSLPRTGMGRSLSPVLYGTADAGFTSRLTRSVDGRLRYRFEGTRMLEAGMPPGLVHAPSAELSWNVTARAALGTEYRFQYFIYGVERAIAHSPVSTFRYRTGPHTQLVLRAGPVFYKAGTRGQDGVAPRLHAQFSRSHDAFELGLQAGQDLLGATGFSSAVWAQYAGLHGGWHLSRRLRLHAGTYAFRNGAAPGTREAWLSTSTDPGTAGYAVGGGVEWSLTRHLLVQGQVDRISQVGSYVPDVDLSRNVVAVRLLMRTW